MFGGRGEYRRLLTAVIEAGRQILQHVMHTCPMVGWLGYKRKREREEVDGKWHAAWNHKTILLCI